jgi:hypothetical protein
MKIQNIITWGLLLIAVIFIFLHFTQKPKTIIIKDNALVDSLKRELVLTRAARDTSVAREKRKDEVFKKALSIQQRETREAERTADQAVQRVKDMQAANPMPERDSVVDIAIAKLKYENESHIKSNLMLSAQLEQKTQAYDDLAAKSETEARILSQILADKDRELSVAQTDAKKTARKLRFWKGAAVAGTVAAFVVGLSL